MRRSKNNLDQSKGNFPNLIASPPSDAVRIRLSLVGSSVGGEKARMYNSEKRDSLMGGLCWSIREKRGTEAEEVV